METDKKNTKQLKGGVLLSYIVMVIEYLVSIIYTPIMIRLLGQSEYGNYNYILSVVNYLTLFSCGFGSAYIRFRSRIKANPSSDENDLSRLNGMFLTIFMVMGSLALIIGIISSFFSNQIFGGKLTNQELGEAQILIVIMVINIFIAFPASVFNSFIISSEKFIFQKLLVLFQTILKPLIILPLLFLGFHSVGLAVGTLFASIIIFVINSSYCIFHEKMKFRFDGFKFEAIREIVVFSSFLLISMIVDQINWSVDKFLLGKMRGTLIVAIYSVGATLNTYYKALSEYISNVFVPRINRMIANKQSDKEVTALFIRIGRIQFYVLSLICTGFFFLGKQFLTLWVGEAYKDAYIITLLLMIPVTIPEIQKLGIEVLKAKNMHKFRSVVYLAIAILNVIMSIPLCMKYGAIGCAFGTAITVIIGNGVVINIYYYKRANLDIPLFWKEICKIFKGLIIPLILGFLYFKFIVVDNWFMLLISACIYAIVFFASMWMFCMNSDEKRLVSGIIPIKLRKKYTNFEKNT